MATDEVMKNYFARFIGHEMMFMVFSSDFHGIFTNLSFIVNADTICFVSHQFGLLCANLHSNAEEVVAR